MIKTFERKRDEISNPREEPHSMSAKSSNENTPNIPKKSLPLTSNLSIDKIGAKKEINQLGKFSSINKIINNKSEKGNYIIIGTNISHNSNDKKKGKQDFIVKKRRRNRCSYSNCRNKICKRRYNNQQLNQEKNNLVNKGLISKNASIKKPSIIELKEGVSKEEERKTEKISEVQNENSQSNKKKTKVIEKELIANAEKVFMDNLNKQYSDEQYNKDLEVNLKEKKVQFMKENFPVMFRKDKYYLYTILLKKRRAQPIHFIQPNALAGESQKLQTLYLNEDLEHSDCALPKNSDKFTIQITKNICGQSQNKIEKNKKTKIKNSSYQFSEAEMISLGSLKNNNNNCKEEIDQIKQDLINPKQPIQEKNKKYESVLSDTSPSEQDAKNLEHIIDSHLTKKKNNNNKIIKCNKTYNMLPKHIWSLPKEKSLDVEDFYDDCIQIWPFNQCTFIKEIALEFLMKNNYSSALCLERINDFVSFMQKRAEELNFSIINENEKTVKKYSLRNTKTIN